MNIDIININNFFKKHSKIWGIVFAVAISILIYLYRDELKNLEGYGYVGLFLLNTIGSATLFLPAPLFVSTVAFATFLNPLLVGIIAAIGSTLGEVTGYMAGLGGGEFVPKSSTAERIYKWMDRYGTFALFVMAAIPNPFFDIAGVVAGATKMSISKYFVGILAGKLIKFSALAFFGASVTANL